MFTHKLGKGQVDYGIGHRDEHCGKSFEDDKGYCRHFIEPLSSTTEKAAGSGARAASLGARSRASVCNQSPIMRARCSAWRRARAACQPGRSQARRLGLWTVLADNRSAARDPFQPQPLVAALSPLNSGSKSDDRRDDRPAASSPEPADTSRRLWPHPGRVRSTRAAILTTDQLAATTAAATAAQRREPRSRDFASSLLPFNKSTAKRRRKGTGYQGGLSVGPLSGCWKPTPDLEPSLSERARRRYKRPIPRQTKAAGSGGESN